jgi:tRNA (cmo5U34)-methyltransferase
MSKVGDGLEADNANWNFKGNVAKNFDQHVSKSVPFYNEAHSLICNLSDFFILENSICYELGCSTGELSLKLARHNKTKSGARFIGIDIEDDMVSIAKEKVAENDSSNIEIYCDDVIQFDYEKADLIVAFYTVQFIRPKQRQILIDKIYETLNWGGAFVLFEKVRANDARFQDMMTSLYCDYKVDQGYTPDEIIGKSRSLKGVLEPYSTEGNIDFMKRAGFKDIMSVMKYTCFEGFVAIK